MDVDLDAPANAGTPEQSEEDAGSVFVSRVPLAGLGAALEAHTQRGGVVFAGLYALATGLSVAAA